MKFCLRGRQIASYLKKADEIYIEYRDRKAIPDYAKKYPNATLTLEIPPHTEWDLAELKDYAILSRSKLKLCVPEMSDSRLDSLREAGIPYFWGYAITSAYELYSLIAAGVCEARITAPLFFQTDVLRKCGIPIRVTANVAHDGYIPTTDGVIGSWIRPEDLNLYEGAITTIEFADCDNSKEQALYRIYAEQHAWPGKVNMIISNINDDVAYNRMLPEDFTKARLNCGQRCMSGSACRLCYRYLSLANPDLLKGYLEAMENN